MYLDPDGNGSSMEDVEVATAISWLILKCAIKGIPTNKARITTKRHREHFIVDNILTSIAF